MAYTFKHGDRPLEDYTIQRAVGRGGFGEVYYAVSDGGREVALKYLRENPQIELRGVSHCMNLKSPHLVTIFDVKKNADGEYFIVMEYSSGPSLRDLLIAEPDGIGPQKAAFFLREIAKGLGYLHDQGIVHRDLKPGNIFYDEGYVKIGDYGLSKFIAVSRHSAQTASVGTVHYMAPEVGSGNYHRGIDIYALGVILYEMLLGKVPFEGGSMGEVLMKHLTAQPEVANLPEPFGKIIKKALEKDPKDRYQTVYEMVEDLLGVEDVKTSLAGFNPVSLAGIERHAASDEFRSPVRSPNPAPPFARMQPAAEPVRRKFDLDVRELPPGLEKRLRATSERVEQRVRKLERKFGPRAIPQDKKKDQRSDKPEHDDAPRSRGEIIERMLLALAMAGGLGALVGFLSDSREEGFVAAILGVIGVSAGVGTGCWVVSRLSRRRNQPRWVERFSLTVPAAFLAVVPMMIFSGSVSDDHALATWFALVATVFVVNWWSRVRLGGRGELSVLQAVWPGLLALIITAALTDGKDKCMVMGGGIAAASALVVQALGWLFPLQRWLAGAGPTTEPKRHGYRIFGRRAERNETPPSAAQTSTRFPEHSSPGGAADLDDAIDVASEPEPQRRFLVEGAPRRWTLTRIVAAFLCFGLLIGAVACIVMLANGTTTGSFGYEHYSEGVRVVHREMRYHTPDERMGMAIGAAACLGFAMLAFRKTTRLRTGGFYRDTLRPFLMTVGIVGTVAGMAAIKTGVARGDDQIAATVGAVVSFALLLAVLVKRGKRYDARSRGDSFHDVAAEPTYRASEEA